MTGAAIFESFLVDIQELFTGYVDPGRGNIILNEASFNVIDGKIQGFQSSNKITGELEPLIVKTTALVPSSGFINISNTSTTVPDFYSYIMMSVTSSYRGTSITRIAKERKYNEFNSNYSEGDARYPRYYISSGKLNVEPSDATSVTLTYFRTPFTINVEDTTTDIPYNKKLIDLIKYEAMVIMGIANRDPAIIQGGQLQKTSNP